MTTALSIADTRARDAVLRQLEWDPQVDASAVTVAVKDGAVTLTGYVDSYYGKLAAERDARRVQGVRAVANDIQVRPMLERTDTDIAEDAATALRVVDNVPDAVQATVHHGHISLTGRVQWVFQRDAAERAVRHLRGVRGVANHISVTPHAVQHDVRRQIVRALHRSADVTAGDIVVEVAGTTATLTGVVGSLSQREAAEWAAANTPGVTDVVNHLNVRAAAGVDDTDELC